MFISQPKRRRSTAEPALGGPSRRKPAKPTQPVVLEESEPEEVPVRKVSKSKKAVRTFATVLLVYPVTPL